MASSPVWANGMDGMRDLALRLVNQSRSKNGLPPMMLEPKLNVAAQSHAEDMLLRNYYSHHSPEGETVGVRYRRAGGDRWLLIAENIAKCDGCSPPLTKDHVRQMHEGWMNSPGHRANILRPGLNALGYGLTAGTDGRLYAVQTFAGPGAPDTTASDAGMSPLTQEGQAKAALRHINEKRKATGRPPLALSAPLTSAVRTLMPGPGDRDYSIRTVDDIYAALPEEFQPDWQSLAVLSAVCGGCGVAPTEADVAYFTRQWFKSGKHQAMLLAEESTHLGFAIAANGQGKKVAAAIVGILR